MTELIASVSDDEILNSLSREVAELREVQEKILSTITDLLTQLEPMIEQVSNGPIGKILGIKS